MPGGNPQTAASWDNGDEEYVVPSREVLFYRLCRARGHTLFILGCILAGLSLVPAGLGGFAIYRITSEMHGSYSLLGVGAIIFVTILAMATLLAIPILAVAHLLRRYNFSDLMQTPEQNMRGRR